MNGKKRDLYLVSGSSKTDEYPEILQWMDQLLEERSVEIGGRNAMISKLELEDAISGRNFGSQYRFSIELDDGKQHTKSLIFLNNLIPVNFLFYGVTTEVIDEILSQIVSVSVAQRPKAPELTEARLYAVDFDRVASLGVYGSRPPAHDLPRPEPGKS